MKSNMHCEILEKWDDLLSAFPAEKKDIYFTEEYLGLYETPENKALCAVCTDGDRVMLMPFLRGKNREGYDFETAYGYGGPISNTDDTEWCHCAFDRIHGFLKDSHYVCGFTRFHPLLCNERLAGRGDDASSSGDIRILYDRQTVAMDTAQSVDEIWQKQITSKNRNMIRKAEKNLLTYKAEYNYASYDEFITLYRSTMQRLSADEFYFFDDRYFDSLSRALAGQSFLGTVRKDGKLICAAIFMFSECYGHYHLEGSDRDFSGLGANNYLLWMTACEMHELGIREFHLGGGTSSSPEDSLYKFKKAFCGSEKQFHIGKEIFDREAYESLCREWEGKNPDKKSVFSNRLLRYRYS